MFDKRVIAPVEKNPVVLVRFKKDIPADLLTVIGERFTESIVDVVTEDETEDGTVLDFPVTLIILNTAVCHDNNLINIF